MILAGTTRHSLIRLDPHWDEELWNFDVEAESSIVRLEVWDKDTVQDDSLGSISIPISMTPSEMKRLRFHLDRVAHGELEVEMQFLRFQSGESTWDYDGEQIDRDPAHPFHDYVDGYQPSITDPFDPKEVAPEWFATLSSAGAEQAYQTLPEPKNGPYGHAQATGTWYRNAAGNFIDSYVYPTHYAEQAELFDASVSQYDAYGRPKSPYPGNPAMLLHDGYRQQAVNSTLACQSGGCNATAELSFSQEGDLQNCKLSVKVKPTDFGVNKVVEFITVNDHTVSLNCQPPSSDCSEADKLTSLFDCVFEIDVQHLLSNRSLQLSAKISDGVNKSDCAYKGNLLYAVPQVTCLVGPVPGVAMNISDVLARPVATPIKLNQKLKSRKAASRHLRVKQQ